MLVGYGAVLKKFKWLFAAIAVVCVWLAKNYFVDLPAIRLASKVLLDKNALRPAKILMVRFSNPRSGREAHIVLSLGPSRPNFNAEITQNSIALTGLSWRQIHPGASLPAIRFDGRERLVAAVVFHSAFLQTAAGAVPDFVFAGLLALYFHRSGLAKPRVPDDGASNLAMLVVLVIPLVRLVGSASFFFLGALDGWIPGWHPCFIYSSISAAISPAMLLFGIIGSFYLPKFTVSRQSAMASDGLGF